LGGTGILIVVAVVIEVMRDRMRTFTMFMKQVQSQMVMRDYELRLLAQVYDTSVGELIRNGTAKHVEELTSTDEFRTKAVEFQKMWDEVYSELVKPRNTNPRSTARKRRKRE
jgi:hypothetical protein